MRTRKPNAGLEALDAEQLALAMSPEFWRMIESRRQGPEISLAESKKRLGIKTRKRRKRTSTHAAAKSVR
jgi:hypothetical protein